MAYSDEESRVVQRLIELQDYYLDSLRDTFTAAASDWELWNTKTKDWRRKDEQWRAFVHVPRPFSTVQTHLAQLMSIMLATDPLVQPDPVSSVQERFAAQMTDNIDYMLRANHFSTKLLPRLLLAELIQGLQFIKVGYVERKIPYRMEPADPETIQEFQKAVQLAEETSHTKAPTDPEKFQRWRYDIMLVYKGLDIPDMPSDGGDFNLLTYRGPRLTLPSLFDMRFDPRIEDCDAQPTMMHRMIKPMRWLMDRCKPDDPNAPFDFNKVKEAQGGGDTREFREWQDRLAKAMGLGTGALDQIVDKQPVELFEVFQPAMEGYRYMVVMNRKCAINKDLDRLPNGLYCQPFSVVKHIDVPGFMVSPGILRAPSKLFREHDLLRSLRIDAITSETMPVYTRLAGLFSKDLEIRPGLVIPVNRPDALAQLNRSNPQLFNAFREVDSIIYDEDEATGTPSNVRGQAATIGRVSASAEVGRLDQAQLRPKLEAAGAEAALSELIPMMLMVQFNRSPKSAKLRDMGMADPLSTFPKERLIEALQMGYRFRGATTSLNRESAFQAMMAWYDKFGPILDPKGTVALATRSYEVLGLKDVQGVVGNMAAWIESQRKAAQQGQPPSPPGSETQVEQPQPQPPQEGV